MRVTVEKLAATEQEGDWHDRPYRWVVKGPRIMEEQKFPTKKLSIMLRFDGIRIASYRRSAVTGSECDERNFLLDGFDAFGGVEGGGDNLAKAMKEYLLQIDGTEPGKWPRAIVRRRRDRI
jgi:hypothetical protein